MPKLKILSGDDLVSIFASFGFFIVSQRGSHIKLRRLVKDEKQTLTVPQHVELDKGTTRAIFSQALRYISEKELRPHFYSNEQGK